MNVGNNHSGLLTISLTISQKIAFVVVPTMGVWTIPMTQNNETNNIIVYYLTVQIKYECISVN